jgi:hypothetical protein
MKGVKQSNILVSLVDAFGRTVWAEEKDVQENALEAEIVTPGLAAGMYWLKANIGEQSLMKKVIIR